jgi:hypothetical protein
MRLWVMESTQVLVLWCHERGSFCIIRVLYCRVAILVAQLWCVGSGNRPHDVVSNMGQPFALMD